MGISLSNQLRIRRGSGVRIEQSRLIREHDQQVCINEVGHQCSQCVVVTKSNFVGDHGIVLINNGNDPLGEQRLQRRPRIEVTLARANVVMAE